MSDLETTAHDNLVHALYAAMPKAGALKVAEIITIIEKVGPEAVAYIQARGTSNTD